MPVLTFRLLTAMQAPYKRPRACSGLSSSASAFAHSCQDLTPPPLPIFFTSLLTLVTVFLVPLLLHFPTSLLSYPPAPLQASRCGASASRTLWPLSFSILPLAGPAQHNRCCGGRAGRAGCSRAQRDRGGWAGGAGGSGNHARAVPSGSAVEVGHSTEEHGITQQRSGGRAGRNRSQRSERGRGQGGGGSGNHARAVLSGSGVGVRHSTA